MAVKKRAGARKSSNSHRKSAARRAPVLKTPKPIRDKQTRLEIIRAIAEDTGLTAKQVKEVFLAAGYIAKCHLTKKGSGEFAVPEMAIKIVRKVRPATKKRLGRNPRTGETVMIAARPKREVIKVRALKALKDVLA